MPKKHRGPGKPPSALARRISFHTGTEGGLAAAVACVAAMYARGAGPGLTAFSDGGKGQSLNDWRCYPASRSDGARARRERDSNRSRRWRRSFSLKRLRGRQLMP